jgi:hypothetical protein
VITLGELLHGTDEDFVVNLYLAALGRWPDEAGQAHHLGLIAGQPESRAGLVRGFLNSEEARQRPPGIALDAPEPVPAERALAAQLRLRTEVLRAAIAAPREAPTAGQPSALAGEIMALGAALEGLRAEVTERLAALEARLAGMVPPAPALSPAVSLDYVNDLVEGAQAPVLRRLRALEARVLEGGGGFSGS